MLTLIQRYFHRENAIQDLRAGTLDAAKIRNILLALLVVSLIANFFSSLYQVLMKGEIQDPIFFASYMVGLLFGLAIAGAIAWFLIQLVYKANGGAQGQHLLERLTLLGLYVAIRFTLIAVPIMLLAAFLPLPRMATAFAIMVALIAIFVWFILDIRKALRQLSGQET